jgi:hypothetical protein
MDTVAPVTAADLSVLVTLPINENVDAGPADGVGDVGVAFRSLHAHVIAKTASRTKQLVGGCPKKTGAGFIACYRRLSVRT